VVLLQQFAGLSTISSLALTLLFCGYQALVFALWGFGCSLLASRFRVSWLICGPLLMALAESIVPFFFKMYLAITVWQLWPLTQIAEFGGPPAVSALLMLTNIVLAESIKAFTERRQLAGGVKTGTAVIVAIILMGLARAGYVAAQRDDAPALQVGILQPNFGIVPIEERERHGEKYIRTLRQATRELGKQRADLIIWPESAWPFLFDRQMTREYPAAHPWALRPGVGGRLLFGTLSHTFGGKIVYNSAVLVNDQGLIAGRYDKRRLVPFAEFVPLADRYPDWAKEVRKKTPLWPEITAGDGPRRLLADGELRIGPLICSEDIDMGYVHALAKKKPNLLVSLASDAWFGDSGGAPQHLALAALRAIETRRDFVRATNTGVSAIIDALGRIKLQGSLYEITKNGQQQPTLLTGEVRLLDVAGLAPWTARFVPLLCLLGLAAAILQARKE
jgi:apolipoprotein N-acyltransferase